MTLTDEVLELLAREALTVIYWTLCGSCALLVAHLMLEPTLFMGLPELVAYAASGSMLTVAVTYVQERRERRRRTGSLDRLEELRRAHRTHFEPSSEPDPPEAQRSPDALFIQAVRSVDPRDRAAVVATFREHGYTREDLDELAAALPKRLVRLYAAALDSSEEP